MKKCAFRLLIIVLLFTVLFQFAGCGKSSSEGKGISINTDPVRSNASDVSHITSSTRITVSDGAESDLGNISYESFNAALSDAAFAEGKITILSDEQIQEQNREFDRITNSSSPVDFFMSGIMVELLQSECIIGHSFLGIRDTLMAYEFAKYVRDEDDYFPANYADINEQVGFLYSIRCDEYEDHEGIDAWRVDMIVLQYGEGYMLMSQMRFSNMSSGEGTEVVLDRFIHQIKLLGFDNELVELLKSDTSLRDIV